MYKLQVRSILTRDPANTLKSLKEELFAEDINTSLPSISKCIKNIQFTRKRLCKATEERNSTRTLDARQVYCQNIQTIPDARLVFLDETGFNLHMSKHYGYSPINAKCYKTVPANRGRNISLMLAINMHGIVGFKIKEGSFDGTGFMSFITEGLLPHFNDHQNDVLVMDNCRFHHRADVRDLLEEHNIHYMYLPAYSPQLNPIEQYFSHLKAKYSDLKPLSRNKEQVFQRVTSIINGEQIDFDGWFR